MRGRHVILVVAGGVVAISTAVGATVPMLFPTIAAPPVLPLPASVVGYAAYGGLAAAALCAVGLLAVEAASRAE
jgi:hypothetical protein